jgi:GT2 family glycosyltransferase
VPTVSAIVPATNSPPTLARCLAALRASTDPPDETIVVDGPAGAGPAAARNAGAARATGDVLLFVDADVLVGPEAVARVRAAFARDPALDALFGAYDDTVATSGLVAGFRNLLHHHVHSRSPGRATTFWAGVGAVRREAFLAAGGFDAERYPRPSIEDVELGVRLAAGGRRIALDPGVQGTHLKEWTLAQMLETDFRRRGLPWARLLLERRELPATLNLGWRDRLAAAAALAGAGGLLAGRPRTALAAAAALVALNHGFFRLLLRRLGPAGALAGIPLYAAHQLAAAASVPAALALHLLGERHRGGYAARPRSAAAGKSSSTASPSSR